MNETSRGKNTNEVIIKNQTGGEPLSTRKMFCRPEIIPPRAKLNICSNNPFTLGDDQSEDDLTAWERRFFIFEYKSQFIPVENKYKRQKLLLKMGQENFDKYVKPADLDLETRLFTRENTEAFLYLCAKAYGATLKPQTRPDGTMFVASHLPERPEKMQGLIRSMLLSNRKGDSLSYLNGEYQRADMETNVCMSVKEMYETYIQVMRIDRAMYSEGKFKRDVEKFIEQQNQKNQPSLHTMEMILVPGNGVTDDHFQVLNIAKRVGVERVMGKKRKRE